MPNNIIYGVDITKKVTPIMVRDAIIDCFYKAHEGELEQMKKLLEFESEEKFSEFKQEGIESTIRTKFDEVGGDFDNPTKEVLIRVVMGLKDLAKLFRDQKVIEKHAGEIMQLINKLD